MLTQILLGILLTTLTALLAGGAYAVVSQAILSRRRSWLNRKPHAPKRAVLLAVCVFLMMLMIAGSVLIWSLTFLALGIFADLEASLYFSLVAFTTLGFGDVLLPEDWRILGAMTAANGLLNFGLLTAMLVDVLRRLSTAQRENNHG